MLIDHSDEISVKTSNAGYAITDYYPAKARDGVASDIAKIERR